MSLFDKCRAFNLPQEAQAAGLYPYFHPISASHGGTEVTIRGRRMVMIGSNNYLGLTHHPKVIAAAHRALEEFGTGCSGSRFLNGTIHLHVELEERLARFFEMEACTIFSTGFQTNLGALSVLVDKSAIAFSDRENHASIFDGLRLSFGRTRKYRHGDMAELERLLQDSSPDKGKLIVTDGVFSMLGDLAPLPRIMELAARYDAKVLVDDAHGVGVMGPGGRGIAAHFGLEIDILTGTFSKSFGSLGGFVAGPAEVVSFVKHWARPMIFSAAMPASTAAATLAALEVMETEPEHQQHLLQNVAHMRRELRTLGYELLDTESAILPIVLGDDEATFLAWRALFDAGVFTNAVIPPAVPSGQCLLRTSYMATHTREQLDRCLEVFARIGQSLKIGP
ncbi:MAG: aminotransferase class I/II-fold pyridoxal phosphate-dependent enzyme [Planctomycetota bacterium]